MSLGGEERARDTLISSRNLFQSHRQPLPALGLPHRSDRPPEPPAQRPVNIHREHIHTCREHREHIYIPYLYIGNIGNIYIGKIFIGKIYTHVALSPYKS